MGKRFNVIKKAVKDVVSAWEWGDSPQMPAGWAARQQGYLIQSRFSEPLQSPTPSTIDLRISDQVFGDDTTDERPTPAIFAALPYFVHSAYNPVQEIIERQASGFWQGWDFDNFLAKNKDGTPNDVLTQKIKDWWRKADMDSVCRMAFKNGATYGTAFMRSYFDDASFVQWQAINPPIIFVVEKPLTHEVIAFCIKFSEKPFSLENMGTTSQDSASEIEYEYDIYEDRTIIKQDGVQIEVKDHKNHGFPIAYCQHILNGNDFYGLPAVVDWKEIIEICKIWSQIDVLNETYANPQIVVTGCLEKPLLKYGLRRVHTLPKDGTMNYLEWKGDPNILRTACEREDRHRKKYPEFAVDNLTAGAPALGLQQHAQPYIIKMKGLQANYGNKYQKIIKYSAKVMGWGDLDADGTILVLPFGTVFPINEPELLNNIKLSKDMGTISTKTAIELNPYAKNPAEEQERLDAEKVKEIPVPQGNPQTDNSPQTIEQKAHIPFKKV